MLRYQHNILLTPPDLNPDDIRHPQALEAWAARLQNGITAGVITQDEADRTWKRANNG
jgi:hypothetical protein